MKMAQLILVSLMTALISSCSQQTSPNLEDSLAIKAIYSLTQAEISKGQEIIDSVTSQGKQVSESPEAQKQLKILILTAVKRIQGGIQSQDSSDGNISFDEKVACIAVGLTQCLAARLDSYAAVQDTHLRFDCWQDYADGNEGNAYQHAYWNALMVKSIGVWAAEQIATAHETGHPAGPDSPHGYGTIWSEMDLYNNLVGRQYGVTLRNYSNVATGDQLYQAVKSGVMKIVSYPSLQSLIWSNAYTPWDESFC